MVLRMTHSPDTKDHLGNYSDDDNDWDADSVSTVADSPLEESEIGSVCGHVVDMSTLRLLKADLRRRIDLAMPILEVKPIGAAANSVC